MGIASQRLDTWGACRSLTTQRYSSMFYFNQRLFKEGKIWRYLLWTHLRHNCWHIEVHSLDIHLHTTAAEWYNASWWPHCTRLISLQTTPMHAEHSYTCRQSLEAVVISHHGMQGMGWYPFYAVGRTCMCCDQRITGPMDHIDDTITIYINIYIY